MIDRLGRPLGDRSPRRSPRTAGPTAEHDARLGSISPTLVRISQQPWSPSSDWAGLEQQQASCARTTKQQLQNQGMEIVVGWEPKDEVGTTQAVHGPTEAFQQGQKLRSPPSTTDTVATNENRSGRREAERSHPRERGGCEGGRRRGRSDHGDSGFPLLGRMPFRKWARAARVGVVCLGKGSQGPAGMEPGPESMTTMIGESKFSLKVRVLSGSLRRNERASSARCEGGGQWSSR